MSGEGDNKLAVVCITGYILTVIDDLKKKNQYD